MEKLSSLASQASKKHNGWHGVDLDATLAHHTTWKGSTHIGEPIKPMVDRVKRWLAEGKDIRIFTARANDSKALPAIREWCRKHIGKELPITATKDRHMLSLWDDRAVQVVPNTGKRADGKKDDSLAKHAAALVQPEWKVQLSTVREKIAGMRRSKRKEMLTKTQAEYTDKSQRPGQTCSACVNYSGSGRCGKVAGLLSGDGWCKFFAQKEAAPASNALPKLGLDGISPKPTGPVAVEP